MFHKILDLIILIVDVRKCRPSYMVFFLNYIYVKLKYLSFI